MKSHLFVASVFTLITAVPVLAETATPPESVQNHLEQRGDRIDARLDRRGEAVNERLDQRGERVNDRLDQRGENVNDRLDRKAERAEAHGNEARAAHLDARGDRVENRLDKRGDRVENRLDRRGDRVENKLDKRGDRGLRGARLPHRGNFSEPDGRGQPLQGWIDQISRRQMGPGSKRIP